MEQQQQQQQHRFVEVLGLDGKTHRFASGSRAGFAVDRINCKPAAAPHHRLPRVACIQARNDGEEPVDFGPDALLVHYGDGWTLHAIAVLQSGLEPPPKQQSISQHVDLASLFPGGKLPRGGRAQFTWEYVGKIVLCFLFMLVLGSTLKWLLEWLPNLLSSAPVLVSNDTTHEL